MTGTEFSNATYGVKSATLMQWCQLHHCGPDQVLRWLETPPAVKNPAPVRAQDTGIEAAQVWHLAAQAVATALPAQRDLILETLDATDLNTAPDVTKYPNAFTLHDTGKGRPYVSVPYAGTPRDILTLAHEFGHAVQILNTDAALTPPVLREVCAFLAEHWLLDHLATANPALHVQVQVPWARSVAADFGHRRATLLTACDIPTAPYDYAWNYPLARRFALAAAQQLGTADQWCLFTGTLDLPTLAHKLGL